MVLFVAVNLFNADF